MKVFTLMYWDYDATHFLGVFSTQEKAQEKIDSLKGTPFSWQDGGTGYQERHFEIGEENVL